MTRQVIALLIGAAIAGCAPQPVQPSPHDQFEMQIQDSVNRTRMDREAYIAAHPGLSPEFQDAILHGKVLPGMTKEDVLGIEHVPPAPDCPSSESTNGSIWDYCVQSTRIGPVVMPEMHETIAFDKTGHVVSVTKSGHGHLRNVLGAPIN
jgi:hypothetical protein